MPQKIVIASLLALIGAALLWGGFSRVSEDTNAPFPKKTVEIVQVAKEYEERIKALENNILLLREGAQETKALLLELRVLQGNLTKDPGLKSSFSKEQLQDMQYERLQLGTEDEYVPQGISVTGKYGTKEEALKSLGYSTGLDSFELIGQEFIGDG